MDCLPDFADWPLHWHMVHIDFAQDLVNDFDVSPMEAIDLAEARLRIGYIIKKKNPDKEILGIGLTMVRK